MAKYILALICALLLAVAGCDGAADHQKQSEEKAVGTSGPASPDQTPPAAAPSETEKKTAADGEAGLQPDDAASSGSENSVAEAGPVVATVNGTVLSRKMFEAQVAMTAAEDMAFEAEDGLSLRLAVLNNMVSLELACQEAVRLGYAPSEKELDEAVAEVKKEYGQVEDFASLLALHGNTEEDLRKQLAGTMAMKRWQEDGFLAEIQVSPEESRDFYERHQTLFQHGDSVRAGQIFFEVPLLAPQPARDKIKARAELTGELLKAGEDFNYLASEMSTDPEDARKMGYLGWVERGQLLGVLEQALFSLKAGEASELIESPLGYHFFKAFETREAGRSPFSEVRGTIVAYLAVQKLETAFREKMVDLFRGAEVLIQDPELKKAYDELMAESDASDAASAPN